jgi:hypothetical protein
MGFEGWWLGAAIRPRARAHCFAHVEDSPPSSQLGMRMMPGRLMNEEPHASKLQAWEGMGRRLRHPARSEVHPHDCDFTHS